MENISERQYRHEKLVDCLMMFSHYNCQNNKTILRKRKKSYTIETLEEINEMELNSAVALLYDVFNIHEKTCENLNLVQLIKTYFRNPDKRKKIKELLDQAS